MSLIARGLLLLAIGGFAFGGIVIALHFPLAAVVTLLLLARLAIRQGKSGGWSHGTSRPAESKELKRAAMIGGDRGLVLGRIGGSQAATKLQAIWRLLTAPPSFSASAAACNLFLAASLGRRLKGDLIRVTNYTHLMTVAATGRGKGVGVLVPNLLTYRSSCVVTDPKGELFKLTSEHRRKILGHKIILLDPFGIGGRRSNSFNPLDIIEPDSPHLLDESRAIANALIVRTGHEQQPFFNDMAEIVLTVFIAWVASQPKQEARHLGTVCDMVSSPDFYEKTLERIRKSDACGGKLARAANRLSHLVDREKGAVLSTVMQHTSWMDSPSIEAVFNRSSFHPRDLRTQPITVYLVLPPDKLESHAAVTRLWITSLLRGLVLDGADERSEVLFLLDEIGNIGRIQALENAICTLRGYGVRIWLIFQALEQVGKCFGDNAGTVINNIDTQQFFGINAYDTAEMVAKRIGEATIRVESRQRGTSRSHPAGLGENGSWQAGQFSSSDSLTISETGRQLLKPDEIIRMGDDAVIVFHRNMFPIIGRLIKWYADPAFRRGSGGKPHRLGFSGFLATLAMLFVSTLWAFITVIVAWEVHPPVDPLDSIQPDIFGTNFKIARELDRQSPLLRALQNACLPPIRRPSPPQPDPHSQPWLQPRWMPPPPLYQPYPPPMWRYPRD